MNDVQCEIRSRPYAEGLELVGVVWSDSRVSGSYRFMVNKEGPSGSSHVVQRGLFALEANTPQIVGTVSVNTTSGDQYTVRLTVNADGHETICSLSL